METDTIKLVSVRGLADRLKLSSVWLKAEAEGGRIPSLLAGRRRLFNPAAVERVLLDRAAVSIELPTKSEVEVCESVTVPPS